MTISTSKLEARDLDQIEGGCSLLAGEDVPQEEEFKYNTHKQSGIL